MPGGRKNKNKTKLLPGQQVLSQFLTAEMRPGASGHATVTTLGLSVNVNARRDQVEREVSPPLPASTTCLTLVGAFCLHRLL
jgi:hypothetical protein